MLGSGQRPTLVWAGHTDVVPVDDVTRCKPLLAEFVKPVAHAKSPLFAPPRQFAPSAATA